MDKKDTKTKDKKPSSLVYKEFTEGNYKDLISLNKVFHHS